MAGSVLATYDLPLSPGELERDEKGLQKSPMLALGEAGNLFVSYRSELASSNPATGAVYWTYSAAPKTIDIVAATDDSGVVAKTYLPGHAENHRALHVGWQPDHGRLDGARGGSRRLSLGRRGGRCLLGLQQCDHQYGDDRLEYAATEGTEYADARDQPAESDTGSATANEDSRGAGGDSRGLVVDPTPQVLSCAGWLPDAITMIDLLVPPPPGPGRIGHGDINIVNTTNQKIEDRLSIAAVHGTTNAVRRYPMNIPIDWIITVNKKGAFFSGGDRPFILGPSRYAGNTPRRHGRRHARRGGPLAPCGSRTTITCDGPHSIRTGFA